MVTKKRADPRESDIEKYGSEKRLYRTVVSYPFEKWLSEPIVLLKRGVHYGLETVKFAQQIRNYAGENNLDVSIKTRPHAVAIIVWDFIRGGKT